MSANAAIDAVLSVRRWHYLGGLAVLACIVKVNTASTELKVYITDESEAVFFDDVTTSTNKGVYCEVKETWVAV